MATSVEVKSNPKLRAASLVGNFKKYSKIFNPNIDFLMDPKDVGIWYARIRDLEGCYGEFYGGEYIVQIRATEKYPYDPPQFFFYTPNGVYKTNEKICISIGEYHKDKFPAAKGMGGFAQELVNGLIAWWDLQGGINILDTTIEAKYSYAKMSRIWNMKNHGELVERFNNISLYRLHAALMSSCFNHSGDDRDTRHPQERYNEAMAHTKKGAKSRPPPRPLPEPVNRRVLFYLRRFLGLETLDEKQ